MTPLVANSLHALSQLGVLADDDRERERVAVARREWQRVDAASGAARLARVFGAVVASAEAAEDIGSDIEDRVEWREWTRRHGRVAEAWRTLAEEVRHA